MLNRRDVLTASLSLNAVANVVEARAKVLERVQPLSAVQQNRIDEVANHAIAVLKAPGFSIAVARDGKLVFSRGYGSANLENQRLVNPDTVFRIGSITKQFTAAAILLLAEKGRLNVDDKVGRYLPEFPESDRFTIRQMLNHTSGLSNFKSAPFFDSYTRGERSELDMLAYIADLKPRFDFEPGTKWRYSNSGYFLSGVIVERLSGMPFGRFVSGAIFAPLGMTRTAMDREQEIVPLRAAGYDQDPDATSGFANASYASLTVPGAAGGLRSVPVDLVQWHAALFGGRVLKPGSLAEMVKPARLNDGTLAIADMKLAEEELPEAHYGFGLFLRNVDGRPSIGHAGAINGFSGFHESFPLARMQLLVLANCNASGFLLQLPLSRALFAAAGA